MRLAIGHVRLPREDLFVGFVTGHFGAQGDGKRTFFRPKEKSRAGGQCKRSAFLANMSHEICTPWNAIIGFTEVLMGTPFNDEQSRHPIDHCARRRSLLHR